MVGQQIFLDASCDPWEIIGYLLCILYTVQYIVQSITLLSSGLAEVQNKLASLLMRQLELMNYSQSILGINHIHCIVLLMYIKSVNQDGGLPRSSAKCLNSSPHDHPAGRQCLKRINSSGSSAGQRVCNQAGPSLKHRWVPSRPVYFVKRRSTAMQKTQQTCEMGIAASRKGKGCGRCRGDLLGGCWMWSSILLSLQYCQWIE